jgi:cell division protease FtsH
MNDIKQKRKRKRILIIVGVVLLVCGAATGGYFLYQHNQQNKTPEIPLSEAILLSKSHVFSDMKIGGSQITLTVASGFTDWGSITSVDTDKKSINLNAGNKVIVDVGDLSLNDLQGIGFVAPNTYTHTDQSNGFNWGSIVGLLLPFLFVGGFIWLMFFSDIVAGDFNKYKKDKTAISFLDIGGLVDSKEKLLEASRFITDKSYFVNVGAKVPRGVLLTGAPGVGKTMLARAMATEAGIDFYYTSGTEFHSYFVAMASRRVKKLFKIAKKRPSVIFIDEFDSIGMARSFRGTDMSTDNEHTLNQLLAEMDGFKKDTQVIVIAATNHPEVLDPALLRPGRFDRQISIALPTLNERSEIIKIHQKGKPIADDVDLDAIARQTGGLSGADLAGMMNEAALIAGRQHKDKINMVDISNAIDNVTAGSERKSLVLTDADKKVLAYHESGHALVASMFPECGKVQRISILPHGMAGGFTRLSEDKERLVITKKIAMANISILFAGRVAEELVTGDLSSGAQNDIMKANQIATEMVAHYGMGATFGLRYYDTSSKEANSVINEDIKGILDECYATAKQMIVCNRIKLDRLASKLIEVEALNADEVESITID